MLVVTRRGEQGQGGVKVEEGLEAAREYRRVRVYHECSENTVEELIFRGKLVFERLKYLNLHLKLSSNLTDFSKWKHFTQIIWTSWLIQKSQTNILDTIK